MPYSYKGAISFGLVYIPIVLVASTRNNDIGFHLLEKETMSRVQYIKTCRNCDGKTVKSEDLLKGYEYEPGQYVVFESDEFERLKTPKEKNITIEAFVSQTEIDPIYYEKSYYVVPQGGEQAFYLLFKAMEEEGKVGIAKTVLGTKETLIALRVKEGQMILNTLFFADEVIRGPYELQARTIDPKELQLAKQLIHLLSRPFQIGDYHDQYRKKVMDAIMAKVQGKEVVAPLEKGQHDIGNLLDALTQSLQQAGKSQVTPPKVKRASTRKTNSDQRARDVS